jgi:hypothetical protein
VLCIGRGNVVEVIDKAAAAIGISHGAFLGIHTPARAASKFGHVGFSN